MAKLARLVMIGAAIAGAILFWRKRQNQDTFSAASSATIDYSAIGGTPSS
jgi:hypothetical protein